MTAVTYTNNPKSLFRKYAKLVTWFSNTKIGRQYLNINFDEPIGLMLPNGYHKIIAVNKNNTVVEASFSTRAKYSSKLYPALRVVDYFSHTYTSIKEQQLALLCEVEAFSLLKNPFGYRYTDAKKRFATLTAFPDADPETTTVDGKTITTNSSWANARADTVGGTPDSASATELHVIGDVVAGPIYTISRDVFLFDTSSLGASATISAGIFSIYSGGQAIGNSTLEATNPANLSLVSSNPQSNTNLVASDYATSRWGTTKFATDVLLSTYAATDQYNDFTLNANGISNINLAGVSKFGIRPSNDFSDATAPTARSFCYGYFADQTGTSKDPKLVITYTVPASGGSFLLNFV